MHEHGSLVFFAKRLSPGFVRDTRGRARGCCHWQTCPRARGCDHSRIRAGEARLQGVLTRERSRQRKQARGIRSRTASEGGGATAPDRCNDRALAAISKNAFRSIIGRSQVTLGDDTPVTNSGDDAEWLYGRPLRQGGGSPMRRECHERATWLRRIKFANAVRGVEPIAESARSSQSVHVQPPVRVDRSNKFRTRREC
jgi:hypothetical protein